MVGQLFSGKNSPTVKDAALLFADELAPRQIGDKIYNIDEQNADSYHAFNMASVLAITAFSGMTLSLFLAVLDIANIEFDLQ